MPYQKKPKTSYRSTKTGLKFPKKAHVVVALAGGVLEDVHVILDRKKARAKRDELARAHGLVGEQYMDSPHGKECRWSDLDEDEIHLHEVNLEW
jgi:hypothetical protein